MSATLCCLIRGVRLVPLVAALAAGAAAPGAAPAPSPFARWTAASRLPVAGQYHYSLTARVRPLLVFWISRPNVGVGRIRYGRSAEGGRSYELLLGSEPDKAPMGLNRWGYVSEWIQGANFELVGLMTESNEETVEQATAALNEKARAGHPFKAIRSTITANEATAQVVRVSFAEDFTLRDLEAILERLPEGGEPTARLQVPAATSPGFLVALADLVHASVDGSRTAALHARGLSRIFVYDRGLYDLTLRSASRVAPIRVGRGSVDKCLRCEFEVRNRATGNTTSFRLIYPTDGPLAEVPVRIVYRPRWYFEAELTLESWQ